MADPFDGTLSYIASPAAADRFFISTGLLTGGWSLRGDFVFKQANGHYYAAGRLGVGLTDPAVSLHAKSSGEIARLETTTARGSGNVYLRFSDPTGSKGFVGYGGGDDSFYIVNELGSPLFFGTSNSVRWGVSAAGGFYPTTDNSHDIGVGGSNRVRDLFLVNSPTVTSDAREKDWRDVPELDRAAHAPNLTEAELRAGLRIISELGFYRWKTEPDGPLRFGARAQHVRDILADEGLLAGDEARYALFTHHEWEDAETGESCDRYNLDPDQLALFLIAAQQATIEAQEVRLAALEAAA